MNRALWGKKTHIIVCCIHIPQIKLNLTGCPGNLRVLFHKQRLHFMAPNIGHSPLSKAEIEIYFSPLTCLLVTVFLAIHDREKEREGVFRWSTTSPVLH